MDRHCVCAVFAETGPSSTLSFPIYYVENKKKKTATAAAGGGVAVVVMVVVCLVCIIDCACEESLKRSIR